MRGSGFGLRVAGCGLRVAGEKTGYGVRGCEEKDAARVTWNGEKGSRYEVRVAWSKVPEKSDGLRVMC